MSNSAFTNSLTNTLGEVIPKDLSLLKKKLKNQQSVYSDRIKVQSNADLKTMARMVHNEISKLRRKTNNSEGILELMQVSIESAKIVSDHYTTNDLMSYARLAQQIKGKSSRAWKILAGAMIALSMTVTTNGYVTF